MARGAKIRQEQSVISGVTIKGNWGRQQESNIELHPNKECSVTRHPEVSDKRRLYQEY
jgi:hypothetical protein